MSPPIVAEGRDPRADEVRRAAKGLALGLILGALLAGASGERSAPR